MKAISMLHIPFAVWILAFLSSCYPYLYGGPYGHHHMDQYEDRVYCERMMGYPIEMGYPLDGNRDGRISRAEWDARFQAMDADGDGFVTGMEWDAFRKR